MKAVYKKELRLYFHSMTGYIFLAMFLAVAAFHFCFRNLLAMSSDIRNFFSGMISILIFLVPILTMRIFAEEKKMRTDQLLFTAPVSVTAVVVGKFFSAVTICLLAMALTVFYPITVVIFGQLDLAVTIGNYLGLLLLFSFFISVGELISAFSENQIIAAAVTYVVLIGILVLENAPSFFSSPALIAVLTKLSVMERYREFNIGILDPASLCYFLSMIFLMLFLTVAVLKQQRRR